MAGLGDNVGLLFRIKADSSDAIKDLNKVQTEVAGVGKSFAGIANPGAVAAVAITAIAASAAAAAVSIFNLAKETSDYGSKIFDATQKTGLSAETISSLGYAADQSGSSLEKITGSVAKFSTLLGQAANGNEKAQKTLADYGITAKETDQALIQAVSTIAKMTDTTKQSAAAAALFKDRTGEILPVIKSFDGDLPGLIEKLQKMGVVMSDEDARAADEFGDTLDNLNKQATAFGRQMALEFMPSMTAAMNAISSSMANNKDVAQGWGRALAETMDGVTAVYRAGVSVFDSVFNAIGAGFLSTAEKARIFAGVMISALSPVLGILNLIGRTSGLNAQIGGSVNIPDTPNIRIPGGGGGGRRGGGGGGGSAKQDTSVRDAQQRDQMLLAEYKAGNDAMIAENARKLAVMEVDEREHLAELQRLKAAALNFELGLLTQQLNLSKINAKEREELEHKIGLVKTKIYTQSIEQGTEVAKFNQKEHEKELQRIEKEAEQRRKSQEAHFKRLVAYKAYEQSIAAAGAAAAQGALATAGQPLLENISTGAIAQAAAIDTLRNAFQGLGQAIGNTVQAWVLYGNVGGSIKKVTAQILASIAQQAAIQSIFQLGEGFAKLAMAYFGHPMAGASATQHFIAAGVYASIAGVAAVAGRVTAGNSFAQSTAGGGAGSGAQAQQNNNFGGFFNGFQQRQDRLMSTITDRTNAVIGAAAAAIDRFNDKFGIASPADVVMAGAGGASAAIFNANVNEMSKGGSASEMFARASGRFR